MPLRLKDPRKSPNFSVRGTYLGVRVDKSLGTPKRSVAATRLKHLEGQIERGEYPPREAAPRTGAGTFLSAALSYVEAGRRPRYVAKLIKYFGETPLSQIGQQEIDEAAVALHPNTTPATRNACVYIPVSAILHHAGVEITIRKPKGAKGRVITDSLNTADAAGIVRAAGTFDPEYAVLLQFLLYTGVRLGEALRLTWDDVRLDEAAARVRTSKNGDPRELQLREDLVTAMRRLPHQAGRKVFRFRQGGHLKHQLLRAKLAYLGLDCPVRRPKGWKPPPNRLTWCNHHSFCHTWATWMRRYGGADVQGLVETGRWRDARSARRYTHAVAREEWNRVEKLPAVGGKSVESA